MTIIAVSRYLRSKPKFLSSIRPRALTIRTLSSSLHNNSSPPPRKEILIPDERDLKHWLVFVRRTTSTPDLLIHQYIRTLAFGLRCMEEAKKRIYSVSLMYYYACGALLSEELANKLKGMPGVKKVIPDPYVYEGKKEYEGEPFVNCLALPYYDPKYYEAWIKINGEEEEEEEDEEDREDRIREEEAVKIDKMHGIDYNHWRVYMLEPKSLLSRDEIINNYIKTLAYAIGSEKEARRRIYSVSTRFRFSFGAILNLEIIGNLKRLPTVQVVLPDYYKDVEKKVYGGEPFINGEAVPYDPEYHKGEEEVYRPKFDWFLHDMRKKIDGERSQPTLFSTMEFSLHNSVVEHPKSISH